MPIEEREENRVPSQCVRVYREPLKKPFPGCVKLGDQIAIENLLQAGKRNVSANTHTSCEGFFRGSLYYKNQILKIEFFLLNIVGGMYVLH